jgi:glycerol-3-phosphate dehydrogenase (NAD(P)+)
VTRAAVFGTGSWGTAFAIVLADAGTDVVLWGRDADLCETITRKHENPVYHPGIELPATLTATTAAAAALADAEFVVLAIPSQVVRTNLAAWAPEVPKTAVLVSLIKGIELGTAKRMSEVISETAGVPLGRVAVVSGPNLAREIALRQPAASVVACSELDVADRLQAACHTPYFRPYTNVDVVGCELGGAVKNVIALAVGMAVGMGLGANAQASLITRGLAETARLGVALGADPMTFAGLAGLGDLVATCSSPLSRNRTFGENLGLGMSVEEVVAITRQTAEGVKTCQSVLDLAGRHGVDVPIIEAVVAVVRDGAAPADVVGMLMSRTPKPERHGH